MKTRAFLPLFFLISLTFGSSKMLAQGSHVDHKFADVNELSIAVTNNGQIGYDLNTGSGGGYYPRGQVHNYVLYAGGLWVAGKVNGQLRTAVSYHVSEFQPGPILPDGTAADPSDPLYHVAKYNLGDTPDPALVPLGCPTGVWGHQMLYCVYNDLGPEHANVFQQPPIGLEVQQTVWAYDRSGALGKTLFVRFVITNKNSEGHALDSAYVGLWLDPDIGDSNDDALGCDPNMDLVYAYNGDNDDAGYYGSGAPAVGALLLQGPLVDAPGQTVTLPDGSVYQDKIIMPQTAFFPFLGSTTDLRFMGPKQRDASGAPKAYTYMKGFMGNGDPWADPVTGESTFFPYSGDPASGTGWLFGQSTDIRIGSSCGPITLGPGETQVLVYAIVLGHGREVGGHHLASVDLLKENATNARAFYDNNFVSRPIPVDNGTLSGRFLEGFFQNNGVIGCVQGDPRPGICYPAAQQHKAILDYAGPWFIGMCNGQLRSASCQVSSEFQPGEIGVDGLAVDCENPEYQVYRYQRGDAVDPIALAQGCPAEVLGDEMLHCVYNDLASNDMVYQGIPIGVEVQQTAWAFDLSGPLGQSLFIRYRFINKNRYALSLDSAFVGMFLDPDLGNGKDDAAGCDPALNLVYAYNATNADSLYGTGAPALGCVLLQGPLADAPGDSIVLDGGSILYGKKRLSMNASFIASRFDLYNTSLYDPYTSSPWGKVQAYSLMNGLSSAISMSDGKGKPWEDPTKGEVTKTPFSGDPVAGTGWLFTNLAPPTDVRMGLSAGPFELAAGDTQEVVFALVVGDAQPTGGDNLASITCLKENVVAVQAAFASGFTQDSAVPEDGGGLLPRSLTLKPAYPNPFNPATTLSYGVSVPTEVKVEIFDIRGRRVACLEEGRVPAGFHQTSWSPERELASGVYLCRVTAGKQVKVQKLIYQK